MIAAEPPKTNTINPIDELHNKAMHLADEAFYAKKKEDLETAQTKYKTAFEYEKAAAMKPNRVVRSCFAVRLVCC